MAGKNILIVDDNEALAEALAELLDGRGFHARVAQTVVTALREFRRHGADLALVDIDLPDGDGGDLASVIRSAKPECPVILMSARPEHEGELWRRRTGAFAFVAKPFRIRAILDTINRAMSRRFPRNKTTRGPAAGPPAQRLLPMRMPRALIGFLRRPRRSQ